MWMSGVDFSVFYWIEGQISLQMFFYLNSGLILVAPGDFHCVWILWVTWLRLTLADFHAGNVIHNWRREFLFRKYKKTEHHLTNLHTNNNKNNKNLEILLKRRKLKQKLQNNSFVLWLQLFFHPLKLNS